MDTTANATIAGVDEGDTLTLRDRGSGASLDQSPTANDLLTHKMLDMTAATLPQDEPLQVIVKVS
ncbi:MAG: hypothetical protein ACFB4J_04375, partial [Elainellaceae cyanobacterium]